MAPAEYQRGIRTTGGALRANSLRVLGGNGAHEPKPRYHWTRFEDPLVQYIIGPMLLEIIYWWHPQYFFGWGTWPNQHAMTEVVLDLEPPVPRGA